MSPRGCRDDSGGSAVKFFGFLAAGALVAATSMFYYKNMQRERRQCASRIGTTHEKFSQTSYKRDSYFRKPNEDSCNICFCPFDKSKHHPIAFLPCNHVCCAECSSSIVEECHVCRKKIESRTLLFAY